MNIFIALFRLLHLFGYCQMAASKNRIEGMIK